jgi:hypothetical protein
MAMRRKFENAGELREKIDAYFADCLAEKKPFTVTGLALALDTDRRTLLRYETEYDDQEIADLIRQAKARCEQDVENRLLTGKGSPAGAIFWLKNNAGWRDVVDTHVSGSLDITGRLAGMSEEELWQLAGLRPPAGQSERVSE